MAIDDCWLVIHNSIASMILEVLKVRIADALIKLEINMNAYSPHGKLIMANLLYYTQ